MDFMGIDKNEMELRRLKDLYPLPRSSYSQLNSFKNCPWTFYLTYMTGNFERTGNKYTELGSLLHDVFERQGKQLIAEKPFSESDALAMYNKLYFRIDKKHFDDKEDWLKLYKKGVVAIENYYATYAEELPLFLEREFLTEIGDGIPKMKGFVDRIDGDPEDVESWIITDYKTGSQPKAKAYLKDDFQLGIYVAQVYAMYGKFPKAVQFYHPVPNKFQTALHLGDGVYQYQGQRAPVVEFDLSSTLMDVRAVVEEIAHAVETNNFPKKIDAWSCKNCFHFQSGRCKPFDATQQGWANV